MINDKNEKVVQINYKIRMEIEIKGDIKETRRLRNDTGIEPFIQWAVDDIEAALNGICDIVKVSHVELDEVE